jgi:hypothetical protein
MRKRSEGRVVRLGRAVVLDEHHSGADADGELADEPVVRVRVPEHPAAAVHVEDRRQCGVESAVASDGNERDASAESMQATRPFTINGNR